MARTAKTNTKTSKSSQEAKASAPNAAKSAAPQDARRADPAGASVVTPGAARVSPPAIKDTSPPNGGQVSGTPVVKPAAPSPSAAIERSPGAAPQPAPEGGSGKGQGFLPLLLGGVVAGGIGFAIATLGRPAPETPVIDTSRIDALAAELDAIKASDAPVADLSGFEAAQADLAARIETLTARVDALESDDSVATEMPTPLASDALRAELQTLGSDIAALRDDLTPRVSALEDGLAEANSLAASIESEAEALAREAARNQVRMALQSGIPYADALLLLGDAPEALAAHAETGVAPQASLISAFPDLSREALRAARAAAPAAGVGSLFTNAFNPRSLEPRDGDDPDAVLSRAEAAVREGDLAMALAEIDSLPDEAKAVLDPWIARAKARAAALLAADNYLQDG